MTVSLTSHWTPASRSIHLCSALKGKNGKEMNLLEPTVLSPVPDHAGLFLGVESQLLVETWATGAEPEKLDFLEARMVENALDDFGADTLLLEGFVDDHIPDGRAIHEIREHAAKPHQLTVIPRTERHIGMAQHFFRIVERPVLSPGRLMEQPKKLGRLEFFLFGKGNGGLEG